MKKILSLFSLLCVTVSGTIMSGGGIACRSVTKLNLNNLKISGINVAKGTSNLEIDGSKAYLNVEKQIITQYDAITKTKTLKLKDFASNSTTISNKKSWAVEIYNIDNSTPILNQEHQALNYGTTSVLTDNALQIKVTTKDKNVTVSNSNSKTETTKQATVEGFLNKFIYTNANANQGHDVNADPSKLAAENKLLKTNVIDFSSGDYNLDLPASLFVHAESFIKLKTAITTLPSDKREKISKAIVTNLNNQLSKETKKLDTAGKLKIAQNNVPEGSAIEMTNSNISFFTVDTAGRVSQIRHGDLVSGSKIFIRIDVNNWNYLENYLGTPNTYVYGYLGTVAVRKYDIQNLEFHGITLNVTKYVGGFLGIDAQHEYQAIRDAIITQYNDFFSQQRSQERISEDDFNLASETVDATKHWAIAIENSGIIPNRESFDLGISATHNLANQNNTLNVKVKTNSEFVLGTNPKSITKEIKLNKFVFNNQDANKNHDLQIPTTSATMRRHFNPGNVIDLSQGTHQLNGLDAILEHGRDQSAANLLTTLESVNNDVKLTNAVIDNLNIARSRISPTGISALSHVDSSFDEYLLKNLPGNSPILKIYIRMHQDHYDNNFLYISGQDAITAAHDEDVYLQINISNWNYLADNNHNFICPDETYVYAYVGIGIFAH